MCLHDVQRVWVMKCLVLWCVSYYIMYSTVCLCVLCVCPCTNTGSAGSHLGVKQAVLRAGHQHKNVHFHKVGHLGWVDLPNGNSVGLGRAGEGGRDREGHRGRGQGGGAYPCIMCNYVPTYSACSECST